ncbi:MAG: NAD-dependent epimerase/dehydratase family protein [Candidatus Altiarchaeota archaeon]
MKVMVTGGAGFIGSNTVDLFVKEGFDVSVVDDLSTGYEVNLNEKASFYKADIRNKDLEEVFKAERPDFVVHKAAHILVRKSVKNPAFDAEVNVLGSLNLLDLCRKYDVKKIIYASSGGACYGSPKYLPADEKHEINPLSPYGISKHTVEHYLWLYEKVYGLDYVTLRLGNVYGPRQDPACEAGVIAIFLGKFLAKVTPKINGDGEQTRDYVYVEDVCEANLLSIKKSTTSRIFNIGTGVPTSVNEITTLLQKLIPTDIQPTHGPAIAGEVRDIHLDVSLAKKELGWKPKTILEEGMKKTVEWTKENQ